MKLGLRGVDLNLYRELSRRNVFRVGIAYVVASWVLLQIVDVMTSILELPAWAPKLIFVILAIGLVPAIIFAWAYEMTPDGLKRESEVDPASSITSQTGRKLNHIIIGTLVVAVALLLADRAMHRAGDSAIDPAPVAAEAGNSIAVLPFVNMSSDPEQEFFSDGITEEILNSLASVKKLKVAGRTSSYAFKGQNDDLRRIGDALGVTHILEGSVRKAGEQVRITAQLIQVDNGFHLWSETFDRELTDVFGIQEEIANEILVQLKSQLLDDEPVVTEARRTDPQVYELYLRAKQRIYTRERGEIEMALAELDEAIRLDADYAPALAQRGIATMLLSDQQYGSIPHAEANRRAKRFIDQALALDENLAEGWAALGLYHYNAPGQLAESIDPLVKALAINPNLIDASNWLQTSLQNLGDFRGSREILEDIAERDPLYRPAFPNAIVLFNAFGATNEAEALIRRMAGFDADNPDLMLARAINYMYSGRKGEGLLEMERRSGRGNMSGVDKIFLGFGLLNTLQFERVLEEGQQFHHPRALFALGRVDEAFAAAQVQAAAGNVDNLFRLFNATGRSGDLVDYLEERWPGIDVFAEENRGDFIGYDAMVDVALAYQREGDRDRFDQAVSHLQRHLQNLADQGIANVPVSLEWALLFALQGDVDMAFEHLQRAVDSGVTMAGPPTKWEAALELLADDPRFGELETRILATLNRDRAAVGLPPVDENYQVRL